MSVPGEKRLKTGPFGRLARCANHAHCAIFDCLGWALWDSHKPGPEPQTRETARHSGSHWAPTTA